MSGKVIDLGKYIPTRDGYVFEGCYSDKALTVPVTEVKLTGDKTVYAKWIENSPPARVLPFTDVTENAWSYKDIAYVYEKGLMNGVSETLFAPKRTTSRAMIVTILWRLGNGRCCMGKRKQPRKWCQHDRTCSAGTRNKRTGCSYSAPLLRKYRKVSSSQTRAAVFGQPL